MTNKELLYVEDALNNFKHFNCVCDENISSLQDPTLRAFVGEVQSELQIIYNNLYNTLSK